MRRSNRLVLLVGIFLAIVAFVGILLISQQGNSTTFGPNNPTPPPDVNVVIATADIPMSTRIRAEQVNVVKKPPADVLPGAFSDVSQVVGQVAW